MQSTCQLHVLRYHAVRSCLHLLWLHAGAVSRIFGMSLSFTLCSTPCLKPASLSDKIPYVRVTLGSQSHKIGTTITRWPYTVKFWARHEGTLSIQGCLEDNQGDEHLMGELRIATTDLSASPTTQKVEFKHASGALAKLSVALVLTGSLHPSPPAPPDAPTTSAAEVSDGPQSSCPSPPTLEAVHTDLPSAPTHVVTKLEVSQGEAPLDPMTEHLVQQLVAMGFDRQSASRGVVSSNGDLEAAVEAILNPAPAAVHEQLPEQAEAVGDQAWDKGSAEPWGERDQAVDCVRDGSSSAAEPQHEALLEGVAAGGSKGVLEGGQGECKVLLRELVDQANKIWLADNNKIWLADMGFQDEDDSRRAPISSSELPLLPAAATSIPPAPPAEAAEPPDGLLCPITAELMLDPVLCADGHSYERASIQEWLENHDTSPLTGLALEHKWLVANHALRKVAEEWKSVKSKSFVDLDQIPGPTPCCGVPANRAVVITS